MGVETAIIAATVASAAGGIMEGARKQKAGREAAFETMKTTKANAKAKREELEKFKGRQRMQFLESGVLLEGSPLLVLDETESQGASEIENIREQGFREASRFRRAGRDAFVGSLFSAAGQAASTAASMKGKGGS